MENFEIQYFVSLVNRKVIFFKYDLVVRKSCGKNFILKEGNCPPGPIFSRFQPKRTGVFWAGK